MKTDMTYIFVDDDPFNNMICGMVLEDALGTVDTKSFTKPEEGLLFIRENVKSPTVLFLDINMPKLSGWEFLDLYEDFDEDVKKYINIYMLSSSLYQRDKDKAEGNKNIKGFISKPLDIETAILIAGCSLS